MSSPLYQLELDTKYANQTCGLCGDFNGDPVLNEFVSHGEPHVSPPSALAPPIALPARLSSRVPSQMAPPGGHGCTHTQACTGVRFQHADMHTRIVPARTCTHSPGHLQSQTSSRLDPATASWPWSPPPSPGPV